MAGVYSTRFVELPLEAPSSTSYTVPDGFVAVVRDINCRFVGGSGGPMVVQVADPNFVIAVLDGGDPVTGMAQWRGREVLNAGEELQLLNLGTVEGSCSVSGYLLNG